MHVHVIGPGGEAKFWLQPEIELAKNHRLSETPLNHVTQLIEAHYDELRRAWEMHFSR